MYNNNNIILQIMHSKQELFRIQILKIEFQFNPEHQVFFRVDFQRFLSCYQFLSRE